jgi:hypothetical protein
MWDDPPVTNPIPTLNSDMDRIYVPLAQRVPFQSGFLVPEYQPADLNFYLSEYDGSLGSPALENPRSCISAMASVTIRRYTVKSVSIGERPIDDNELSLYRRLLASKQETYSSPGLAYSHSCLARDQE